MNPRDRLIVALDRPDLNSALTLVRSVGDIVPTFKVGLELFTAEGPRAVQELAKGGHRIFLDAKFHDIPNTVAGACRAAVRTGAWMLNVHSSGGRSMLQAAARAVCEESDQIGIPAPILIGVTVLTSLDRALLSEALGVDTDPAELVVMLAELCQDCGLDGVVASPREAAAIRQACGPDFVIVTPGIRRGGSDPNDQKRSATPADALAAGSNYLVIGRDITATSDPAAAAKDLLQEISG